MILEKIVAMLGFEVDEKPLDQVNEKLEHIGSRLEFLAAAEVVRGIYELAEKFSGLGEQIETAAVSAGITAEQFQKLAFAASQNAVGQGELTGALARLNRMLYQAKDGSKTALDAFASVGITPQQLAGFKNSEDALHGVADAFAAMDDPIKKQAVAMELFGRGSYNMVALLSGGGKGLDEFGKQAEDMGAVLNNEGIESLAKFEKTMISLGQVTKIFLATIASMFAPIIGEVVKSLEQLWSANEVVIKQDIQGWVDKVAYNFGILVGIIRVVIGVFTEFASAHPTLIRAAERLWIALIAVSLAIGTLQFAIKNIFGPFGALLEFFDKLRHVGPSGLSKAIAAANGLRMALSRLALWMAVTSETAFPALSKAAFALAGALEGMTAGTFALWAGGIALTLGAVVLAVQAIWQMLHGKSFWDTWIGEGLQAILKYGAKAWGYIKGIFGGTVGSKGSTYELEHPPDTDFWDKPDAPSAKPGWRMDLADLAQTGQSGMASLQGMATPPLLMPSAAGGGDAPIMFNMPTTNNITVPPGMDPKDVGPYIQRGIQDAAERQLREAHRGLQTAATH